jgi:uncharacterized repeat protein (TIGR01451 family)
MKVVHVVRLAAVVVASLAACIALQGGQPAAQASSLLSLPISPIKGPPGYAMQEPIAGAPSAPSAVLSAPRAPINASYSHTPPPTPGDDLPAGSGQVMTSTTIYYVFWLPTGLHYESDSTGDTNYENLLVRWAQDVGSSQFLNLISQYSGTNGTVGTSVTYGGSWTDTAAYPHPGTTGDPLTDGDIRSEVTNAVSTNGWTEDVNHIVAVFTANGIQECDGGGSCTFSASNGFCAYHDHFSDSGNDAVYAFMGFDNFTHVAGKTCVAGQTSGDNDPNRSNYPNGDVSADAEINTLSHEVIEAETDPHPNDTWTGPNGEIGDACNFNFAPRNDTGADVYLNGHPYIMQQEWSNAVHTCAVDLPTNGFCPGSVSNVCSPTTTFAKSVDNATPRVLSTIHYTLTLDNTNDTGAETNLTLADTVPAGYTVTGLSAPGSASSSSTASSVTVSYDTLPVHQARTVTVTATVPTQAGTTATNCGGLDGSDLLGTALSSQTTSPCASTTPVKIPTIVTYTGATTGDYHDAATVSAKLTDDSSNPLAGKTIDFTLNGSETCSGVTLASGVASCQITPNEAAGSYTLTAAFNDASDPVYDVSSTSAAFDVTKEETTTTYVSPTVILAGSGAATLNATLVEDGANDDDADGGSPGPVPAEMVTLSIGSQSCTDTTDPSGNVSCTIPSVTVPLGPETVGASFAGDNFYRPSSDSTTAIVFAFPSRGAFTLGDVTVATAGAAPVTWWADTWREQNTLSGGIVPSAFKGFAGAITLPTTSPPVGCGSDWTTAPGNSPPPTSDVPSYMGVVVTSSVAKHGSTISGDSAHIVVVKTDPGYGPNPGHPGTGTIVATFC